MFIKQSYDKNKKIFIVNGREDFIVNYSLIMMSETLKIKEPFINMSETLNRFKNNEGGFNTTVNDKSSSSLAITLYGLLLSAKLIMEEKVKEN
ncbi:hypothetical protein CU633_04295 [Bacillus sp. V3-13]|nr:hypothetical protein CU633_04295 [Bacillus sp. V3-13]